MMLSGTAENNMCKFILSNVITVYYEHQQCPV